VIFGRPTNLVLGAVTATLNVAFLVSAALNYPVSPEIVGAVNIAAAAIITLVAGQPPTVNEGDKVNVSVPGEGENRTITA